MCALILSCFLIFTCTVLSSTVHCAKHTVVNSVRQERTCPIHFHCSSTDSLTLPPPWTTKRSEFCISELGRQEGRAMMADRCSDRGIRGLGQGVGSPLTASLPSLFLHDLCLTTPKPSSFTFLLSYSKDRIGLVVPAGSVST